jgi:hypothetical protein
VFGAQSRLAEEQSVSKHVEDVINFNINLEQMRFVS